MPPRFLFRKPEALPVSVETWLLAPIAAPDFSLPDQAGRMQTLAARRGKPVLLHFWSAASPNSEAELANFDQSYTRWANQGLQLLT
jgi:peroxiredoxin